MLPFVYLPPEALKPYEESSNLEGPGLNECRKTIGVLKSENFQLKADLQEANSYIRELQEKYNQLSEGYLVYKNALSSLKSLSLLDNASPDSEQKTFRTYSYGNDRPNKY